MNSGKLVVFRGTLAEAVPHFAQAFGLAPGSPGRYTKSNALAKMMDISENSVVEWFRRGISPSGERRAKLLLLLSLCGYEVSERTLLHPSMVTFFDTIATLTGVDGAAESVGIASDNILIWLRGEIKPKSMNAVVDFNNRFSDRRLAKIKLWKNFLEDEGYIISQGAASPREAQAPLIVEPPPTAISSEKQSGDQVTILILQALRKNIQTSGILQDDARKKAIRQAVGHDEIADLIGDLQKLLMAPHNL